MLESYRRYLTFLARTRLHPKLRRRVGESDLVQQTLVDACQGWESFEWRSAEELAGWLRRILAKNLARAERDHRRGKRDVARERSLDADLEASSLRLGEFIAAGQSTPSQAAIRQESLLRLADAMASLSADQYDAMVLQYWQGWTLEAVGEHLGVSRFTVGRLIRQAVSILRAQLKEDE